MVIASCNGMPPPTAAGGLDAGNAGDDVSLDDSSPAPDGGPGGDALGPPIEGGLDAGNAGDDVSLDDSSPPPDGGPGVGPPTDVGLDAFINRGGDASVDSNLPPPEWIPCVAYDLQASNPYPYGAGVGSDSIILGFLDEDIAVQVNGELAGKCTRSSEPSWLYLRMRSRAFLDARYLTSPGELQLTLNRAGHCRLYPFRVTEAPPTPTSRPRIVAVDRTEIAMASPTPGESGVEINVQGESLGDAHIIAGSDCAHEWRLEGTIGGSFATVRLPWEAVGAARPIYIYAATPPYGSFGWPGNAPLNQRTSRRIPLQVTGPHPAPEIAEVSPTELVFYGINDAVRTLTLTAVDRFTSQMEIVAVSVPEGRAFNFGNCQAWAKTCEVQIPWGSSMFDKPFDIDLYAMLPGGPKSKSVRVKVVVPTPTITNIYRQADQSPVLTQQGFTSQTVTVTASDFLLTGSPDFSAALIEVRSGLRVPYTSGPGTQQLTAEVPAAATAQGGVLSFQFVNPGNTLSNTFDVSTVRGPWLDPNGPRQLLTRSNRTLVLPGVALDHPSQGAPPAAEIATESGCFDTWQIAPTTIEPTRWSLDLPYEIVQQIRDRAWCLPPPADAGVATPIRATAKGIIPGAYFGGSVAFELDIPLADAEAP